MNYGRDAKAALANSALTEPRGISAQIRTGSLAEAFQELNEEVGLLEGSEKQLYERISPALDTRPADESVKESARSGAPLAESVFEYAARVRRVRAALNDISERIAF